MATAIDLKNDLIDHLSLLDKSDMDIGQLTAYAALIEKLIDLDKGDPYERIISSPPFSDMLNDLRASFRVEQPGGAPPNMCVATVNPLAG